MATNLHSVTEYAKLCNVRPATIYLRIANKKIFAFKKKIGNDNCLVIDSVAYPPITAQKAGRKAFKVS